MNTETLNQAKINAFAEKMRDTIDKQELSVLKMEAAEIGISDEQFEQMVSQARQRAANDKDTKSFVQKYKVPIIVIIAVFVFIELFLPIGWGWKILLIFLTLVVGIVFLSAIIVKSRKK